MTSVGSGGVRMSLAAGGLAMVMSVAACGAGRSADKPADASAGKPVIALSNSFIGNSWRKQMVNVFTEVAKGAKKDGLISDFVVANADNTAEQQITQINDLIQKKVDAIVIDAASPTALNGVITKATQAGITVVTFDGTATSKESYNLNYDFAGLGRHMVEFLAKAIGDKGNVLFVRGVAGTVIDRQTDDGAQKEMANHPNLKAVGSVYGNWDDATARAAVERILPSLPKVDAVVINGGGYGVVQAFEAAKRPMPLIYFGNRGYELKWWADQLAKGPYPTESSSATPSVATAAFWLAIEILNGAKPKHELKMDTLTITAQDLPMYKDLPLEDVAAKPYDAAYVKSNLITQ